MSFELEGIDVTVPKDKYLEILGFTTYAYFTGKITAYSGIMGGKRALGEYIENFTYGKVAEVAFQEFLRKKLGLEALTDLDVADFILGMYLPDIIAVKKNGDYEVLKFWTEIKEVRRDQRWLLVSASATRARPYDAYVAVWIGLPDEHVAWLIKNVPEAQAKMSGEWKNKIVREVESLVENIPCKIIGFVTWNDVKMVRSEREGGREAREVLDRKYGYNGWYYFAGNKSLFDPDDPSWRGSVVRENIGFALRRLAKATDWNELHKLILENKRLVDEQIKVEKMRGVPEFCRRLYSRDYRDLFLKCLELQLEEIKKRYGTILRRESWFKQPLI